MTAGITNSVRSVGLPIGLWISRIHVISSISIVMHRIECQICKASCHRVCYSPATTEKDFVCDVCLDNKATKAERTDKKCILCHNDGLLKRIGDNIYGHPICLIRNPSVRLNLENTLQFETEKLAPKSSTKK